MRITDVAQAERLQWDAQGLIPCIAQHALTGEVLMMAWMNRDALQHTLALNAMCYWSRSRGELWRKGETSGNVQTLVSLHADCDSDTLLARVLPAGPSCHTGDWSCFDAAPTLAALDHTIGERAKNAPAPGADAPSSYTHRLLSDPNLRLKKIGEEAVELVVACERGDSARAAEECADLLYHALVACRAAGVDAAAVLESLEHRRG